MVHRFVQIQAFDCSLVAGSSVFVVKLEWGILFFCSLELWNLLAIGF
uniref:Uncharacterized protein n=1 Tax=Arundo donax TaxID=35708 RepID=A0A0A9A5U1_ARUDO